MGNLVPTAGPRPGCSEEELARNPGLKPLCDPRFMQKMDKFFADLKREPELQKQYRVNEEDLLRFANNLEELHRNYSQVNAELQTRMASLQSRLRRMESTAPEFMDETTRAMLNDYLNFLNELDSIQ